MPRHWRGRVDANEAPLRLGICKRLQLQTAARSHNENITVARHALGEEQPRHLMKRQKAWDQPDRAFRVTSHCL